MADERHSARPTGELDRATRERLEYLMGTEPGAINEDDKAFLRGRRDYLTKDQRADYLEDGGGAEPTEPTEPAAEKPKRRRKA